MKDWSLLHIVLIYLAVINVVTFFMYGIDKWKAKKSKWRIRETALLGLAVPAIFIIQLAVIVYCLYR
ncbi:MAG: DUF1294 domain-containing protein [Prevotella sp.]|nr:DUF1294 domain-containing protein [Prevotella sp.]